jgi:hypothetical protein
MTDGVGHTTKRTPDEQRRLTRQRQWAEFTSGINSLFSWWFTWAAMTIAFVTYLLWFDIP